MGWLWGAGEMGDKNAGERIAEVLGEREDGCTQVQEEKISLECRQDRG